MAFQEISQNTERGRSNLRTGSRIRSYPAELSMTRDSRIHKTTSRGRGHRRRERPSTCSHVQGHVDDTKATEARDAEPYQLPKMVRRTDTSLHACSELSISFIASAGLETTEDTNTITLNLMDYFLFSSENWLPELSYFKLHAASFYLASLITGLSNTSEQIAASLGEESAFAQDMAASLAEDEESALYFQQILSVSASDVEDGYLLLYERSDCLAGLTGEYAAGIDGLPRPGIAGAEEDRGQAEKDENFDVFSET